MQNFNYTEKAKSILSAMAIAFSGSSQFNSTDLSRAVLGWVRNSYNHENLEQALLLCEAISEEECAHAALFNNGLAPEYALQEATLLRSLVKEGFLSEFGEASSIGNAYSHHSL